ncbi:MAG TPA: methyltransferase domain-containing protein [Balneolaceae bacterium]|nr:methyltransferase domain-containing protein [Balneolaceae bacterium]
MAHEFSKQAKLYAKYRPTYPDEMYAFIFDRLQAMDCAWDCGTGSGQVAAYLADHFKQVFATDIDEKQLKYAIPKTNITYKKAPAENSGLSDHYFDLITVAQAIHWFNFERFYSEVQRVAKDQALLAAISYGMIEINNKVDPILRELYDEAFGTYFTQVREYIDQQYQTIPFPFEEIPSPIFASTFEWTLEQLEGFFNSWSPVQKMKSEQHYNPVSSMMEKVRKFISEGEKFNVTFPVFMRLGKIA